MSSIATQNVKPTPPSLAAGLNVTGIHGLPKGFPSAVPHAWVGNDFAEKGENWVYQLNDAELVEIRTELRAFKGN